MTLVCPNGCSDVGLSLSVSLLVGFTYWDYWGTTLDLLSGDIGSLAELISYSCSKGVTVAIILCCSNIVGWLFLESEK